MQKPVLSILVPIFNEEKNLPKLFHALRREASSIALEVVFIDNGSKDKSMALLKRFRATQKFPIVIAREKVKGFAPPLNRGVKAAASDLLVTLDADAVPQRGWARAMARSLGKFDLVVGNTVSRVHKRSTNAERAAAFLFRGFSKRAAEGKSHALPWGPTCNLGLRRTAYKAAGAFNPSIGSAFDLAWCWSAIQAGCILKYEARAVVNHMRRKSEKEFLQQMFRYGTGEAVLAHTFSLLQEDRPFCDPQAPAREAYDRLRLRMGKRPLAKRAAAAFASGVFAGYAAHQKGNVLAKSGKIKENSLAQGKN